MSIKKDFMVVGSVLSRTGEIDKLTISFLIDRLNKQLHGTDKFAILELLELQDLIESFVLVDKTMFKLTESGKELFDSFTDEEKEAAWTQLSPFFIKTIVSAKDKQKLLAQKIIEHLESNPRTQWSHVSKNLQMNNFMCSKIIKELVAAGTIEVIELKGKKLLKLFTF